MTLSRTAGETSTEVQLADLVDQFIDRIQAGEAINPAGFAADHPELADSLPELLEMAASMVELRRSPPRLDPRLENGLLGDFRILREVGRGGMGIVYEAEQVSLGRKVALKVLPNAASLDPRQLARFRIEVQAGAAVRHPHIVPILAVGCERSIHYYAMPFIDGCSLSEVIAGHTTTKLGFAEASRLAAEAAEALEHAHALGILHRDVKPANLLIDVSGHLWVADFGLARFLDGGDLTQTGDVIGTLRYLSPEQAAGRRVLDPRSDVYGLGATLYEILTLRPAFAGHDRQDLLRRIIHDDPVAPRRIDPMIPRDLETILARAMAKEVHDRYGSAGEMADDLRRFLDGRPILAKRPGASARVARWAGRHRMAVATAAVVLAMTLGGLSVGLGLLWKEQARTRDNLGVALIALDEFCLSADGEEEPSRDPERAQSLRLLQRKALTIYERALLQNANDVGARRAAARANHRIANRLSQSAEFVESRRVYELANQHMNILVAVDPDDPRLREERANLLADWGASLAGRDGTAQGLLRRALADHSRLLEETSGQARYRKAVARNCLELSKTIGILEPSQAVEKEQLQRRSLELRRVLDDGSFASRLEVAESLAYLGHLLAATDRAGESSRLMDEARGLLKALEAQFPADPACRHKVVRLYSLLALPRYCGRVANPEATLRACRGALAQEARLAADFPFIPDFRAQLAWSHHTLSGTLAQFGRHDEAKAHAREAAQILEGSIREHPTVEHYRRWMSLVCENVATLLAKPDELAEALTHLRRAEEVMPRKDASKPRIARLRDACRVLEVRIASPPQGGPGLR